MFNLERVQTVLKRLDSQTGNNIISLFEVTDFVSEGYQVLYESLVITNLNMITRITSLSPVTPPSFSLEDTDLDRVYKSLNLQWESPRIGLNAYLQNGDNNWVQVGSISLLNPQGYPYRVHNLVEIYSDTGSIELSRNSKLGVQIADAGYGNLSASDTAIIHGILRIKTALSQLIIIVNPPDPSPSGDEDMALQIKSDNYTLVNRDRILVRQAPGTSISLTLPVNPLEGYEVEILHLEGDNINILCDAKFFGMVRYEGQIYVNSTYRGGRLLYETNNGWMPYPYAGATYGTNFGGDY